MDLTIIMLDELIDQMKPKAIKPVLSNYQIIIIVFIIGTST